MTNPDTPKTFLAAPTEIQLGEHWYRLLPINARTQLHIVRRLAPLSGITAMSQGSVLHIARAISQMPEDDVNYVLDACLARIQRKSGTDWASVLTAQGTLAFDDIGGVEQFRLAQAAIRVFQDPFFAMLADALKPVPDSDSTTTATSN